MASWRRESETYSGRARHGARHAAPARPDSAAPASAAAASASPSPSSSVTPWYLRVLRAPVTYVIIVMGIVRVIFGNAMGLLFIANQFYDDALLMNYSLPSHYTTPDVYSLSKAMSFPWFIDLCHELHINLAVGISLLWVAAALAAYGAAWLLTSGNAWVAGFVYVYVLFCPSAFESWCGMRIYRNAILVPSYALVFSLAIMLLAMIFGNTARNATVIVVSVLLGLALSFTYYIADNGSWITYSLAVAAVLAVIFAIRNFRRRKVVGNAENAGNRGTAVAVARLVAALLAVCIPFATLVAATAAYKAVNKRFFGVAQINTRTAGEAGGFLNRLYVIDSPWRTDEIWAPNDAIHQAIDASPTLRKYPELCNDLLHSPWEEPSADPDGTSVHGDLLAWSIKWAMIASGTWESEAQSEALFHDVNAELDAAFANGTLKKTDRIMITDGVGGLYPSELDADFLEIFRATCFGNIRLRDYAPGAQASMADSTDPGQLKVANAAAVMTLLPYVDGTKDTSAMTAHRTRMNSIATAIFTVYRAVNLALMILVAAVALLGLVAMIVRCARRRHIPGMAVLAWVVMLGMVGIAAAYSFSVAWFSQYIAHPFAQGIVNYYSLGNVALFAMCAMCAMAFVAQMLGSRGMLRDAAAEA